MTNDSKENLLKILLNEPNESPGTNKSSFINKGVKVNTEGFNSISRDQLQWQGYTIGLSGNNAYTNYIYIYDPEGNQVLKARPVFKETECDIAALDIDENGNLYVLFIYDNIVYLGYFYNPFIKNADGEYELILKASYNLREELMEMWQTIGGNGTVFDMDIKKSPMDSRFLITWAFGKTDQTYTLISIVYTVSVGTDNTFEYRYAEIGTQQYNWIKNIKPSWTESNVNIDMLILSRNKTSNVEQAEFYKVTLDFSEGSTMSSTLIYTEENYLPTPFYSQGFFGLGKNAVQTDYIYFVTNSVNGNDTTTKILRYKDNIEVLWQKSGVRYSYIVSHTNILTINNQIFACSCIITENEGEGFYKHDTYFMHIVGSSVNDIKAVEDTYSEFGPIVLIQNYFNLYMIYLKASGNQQDNLIYKYKLTYNGIPYFSDNSLISENIELYDENGDIVFDRNLYDKQLTLNTIASISQIPFNYLNDKVIIKEDLMSKNNNIIDENNQEITKNQYEEVIISNLDKIKVWDRNIGSTYNNNSSVEIAKNIYNGFEGGYKISHYRINYANTHTDHELDSIVRTDREALITLYVYNSGIKNIELYDSEFTTPFLTIDMSSYEQNKLYVLKQKVKIE